MTSEELAAYYANLLIAQYKGLNKASNTVYLFALEAIADQIIEAVNSGFDTTTAIGPQLDILASYVGASRNIPDLSLAAVYFDMHTYTSVAATTHGLAYYADDPTSNILYYSLYLGNKYNIGDELLRLFIEFRSEANSLEPTLYNCDTIMHDYFGDAITVDDDGSMAVTYTYTGSTDLLLFEILVLTNSLPKPAGVELTIVYA